MEGNEVSAVSSHSWHFSHLMTFPQLLRAISVAPRFPLCSPSTLSVQLCSRLIERHSGCARVWLFTSWFTGLQFGAVHVPNAWCFPASRLLWLNVSLPTNYWQLLHIWHWPLRDIAPPLLAPWHHWAIRWKHPTTGHHDYTQNSRVFELPLLCLAVLFKSKRGQRPAWLIINVRFTWPDPE